MGSKRQTKPTKPGKKVKHDLSGSIGIVREESLAAFGKREMTVYADEVNLARAVPDLMDGLKPVQRRIMWASSLEGRDFVKTARVVGNVIGRYHPHGDQSVADAITTIVQANVPTIQGKGNWGSLIDPAAAMRYCFVGSTRVSTSRGLMSMDELARASRIGNKDNTEFTIQVDTKGAPQFTSHFVNSGVQDIVRVTTTQGYRTECTPNEPFFVVTPAGYRWVDASELKNGDWLCLKRGTQLEVIGSHKLPLETARFLGYMVGDGYMNAGQNGLGFNQVSDWVFKDFLKSAEIALPEFEHLGKIQKLPPRGYGKQAYNQWGLHSVPARTKLARLGLAIGTSYNQVVPKCVFRGSTKFMVAFLQALFEADGSVTRGGKSSSQVVLHSASRRLLDEVSLILRSQFGIFGNICADGRLGLRLVISGAENIHRFETKVGFRSKEKNGKVYVNNRALNGETSAGSINDCVPFAIELGLSRSPKTRAVSLRAAVKSGGLTSPVAKLLVERDYYYAQVASVVDAGEAQVWDLTVPNTHSFVADGFVVHNTNCRLSEYGSTFFEPDYLNKVVTSFIPNYDDTTIEPVSLPALMPNVLLNGGEGIGVGTTTMLPTFTPESVAAVMKRLLLGEKLTIDDFAKTLKYANRYGGHLVKSKENKEGWMNLFTQESASVQFEATLEVDRDNKALEIDDWPKGLNPIKFINKIRQFAGVDQAFNHKGATGFRIEFDRSLNYAQFDKLVERVQKQTRVRRSFKINVTHRQARVVDGVVSFDTQYLRLSVPKLLITWLRERVALEKRSLEYRIGKQNAAIAYSKLLIFASVNLDTIFKALRSPDAKTYIVKHLKLSPEDADKILELKVRQLSKLDQDTIKDKLKEQVKVLAQLEAWLKKPKAKVADDTDRVMAAIEKDRKFEIAKGRKMEVS